MAEVYLLLGSNLGNKVNYLQKASYKINQKIGHIEKMSSLYQSPPWGFQHKEDFINQLILVRSNLSSQDILKHIFEIEITLGRVKNSSSKTYEARTIDIDILYYDDYILETENLKIPHPEIQNRRFALIPLCELSPDFIHPVLGKNHRELLGLCTDNSKVEKLDSPSQSA